MSHEDGFLGHVKLIRGVDEAFPDVARYVLPAEVLAVAYELSFAMQELGFVADHHSKTLS